MATEEQKKAIVQRFNDEFWNNLNLDVLDEMGAPNFIHQLNKETRSKDEYKKLYATFPDAYPQSHFTIEEFIAEGNKVVILWTWDGTVAKTGEQINGFPGITIFYFTGEKIEKILSCHDVTPFL